MKFQVVCLLALVAVVCSVSGAERPRRGVLAAAPLTAAYYSPSVVASYVAAPSPVVARASRVVGAPGFAARYVAAPVASYPAYTAPVVAPYSVLY
ncbi:uncharacterized protein [Rhodnius prolixus]|uniref:Uncharacterized protein n=1 Tax=Rhodnius prolixus TaxID=13249 RepID=T1HWN0_RHOPR